MEPPIALESIATHKCAKCYKVLKTAKTLKNHNKTCKELSSPVECPHCHSIFTHRSSKSRHMIKCTKAAPPPPPLPLPLVYPINGVHQNRFDFIREHITGKDIKDFFHMVPPSLGFRKFINRLFERPENRIIQKTNPNSTFCKVHRGDNQWEIEPDGEAFKVMTHFLTCAALQSTNQHKTLIKHIYPPIHSYLDDVNTQNEENIHYREAFIWIRLMAVNLTARHTPI